MAKPRNGKNLARSHEQMLGRLSAGITRYEQYRQQILTAAGEAAKKEAMALVEEIPVEEINRDRQGFRVKSLRSAGFETIGDLLRASTARIAAVDGISDAGAVEIRSTAEMLLTQAAAGAKIRISADNPTGEATRLLTAIFRFRKGRESASDCQTLLRLYEPNIRAALSMLTPANKMFRWIFASREEKEKAEAGGIYLEDQWEGAYGRTARELVGRLDGLQAVSGVWEQFRKDPVPFFNTLEEICPGVLGTGDGVYGLPEELAKQIQQEPFYSDGLKCTLRHYQQWGVKYTLHQKRVLLGDEMGLGKTVQAIAVMVSLRNTGSTHFMVVCPASVVANWCREVKKHSDLPVYKVHGDQRNQALEQWMAEGGVAVTTYETTGAFDLTPGFRISAMVVDEAHYIKNPEAKRTKNVRELCARAERILFMTGTALENKVEEMIRLMEILQPEIAQKVRGMMALSAAPQFREAVAPVYYRRRREDVLTELPDLIENEEWCDLGPQEELVYETAVMSGQYAAARRVSWTAPDPGQSCKAQRMLEIIEQAREEGRKVIVFSFFLDTIAKVCTLLGDSCLEPINGSLPPERRQQIVDEFTEAAPGTVLAAQIQAGGTGLNIQAASVVILCEPQFKPSIENQAVSRAYRMGQTRNVLVYRLLCQDTVDERITEILAQKQTAFDAFADKSVVAEESMELDSAAFGTVMALERQRIAEKNGMALPLQSGTEAPPPTSP